MTFSKTTEYALRALTLMTEKPEELLSADYLHKELKIPKKYLQRLLTDLSKSGLIESVRGKYGGYRLGRTSSTIFLSEVIEAVEGFKREPTCFFGFGECIHTSPCAMHDVWAKSQNDIIRVLSNTSLSQLIK
ncbi:MAG TPA: Rrf2 family transcriptional regulator [Ignavibacteriales bacterium]|nr:Rrf2 family transcriptional regulator [Ignavibacteriales bacterium]